MLSSDVIIHDLLIKAKNEGNELLQHFHIKYPSPDVAVESNSIFVGAVSSEPNQELFETTEYRDLVEVLVVTKIRDYENAVTVIKTVIREIVKLIKSSADFPVRPIVRNIAPEYNQNFVLTKGHIMVECLTEIEEEIPEDTVKNVCNILIKEVEEV